MTTSLICPKCNGTMRNYERNGVHVDQCADCRGVFLDRGELEQLVDAENRHYAPPAAAPAPAPVQRERPRDDDRGYDRGYDRDRGYGGGYKKNKKTSFLSELFD